MRQKIPTMLLQLLQSLERNVAIEIIQLTQFECLLCQKNARTHAIVHPNPGEPGSMSCSSWYEYPITYYSQNAKYC